MEATPPMAGRNVWRGAFGYGNVTDMVLTPAEKQRRYRERQSTRAQANPEVIEQTLLQQVERCGEMSDEERAVLANKLTDLASQLLWRAHKLAEIARKVRPPRILRAPLDSPHSL